MRRQKGTIALKCPNLSQNTHRGVKKEKNKENKASFGSSPAQNDNVLVCPPESRTKEASSPGGWHRGMLPMQPFDVKFKVLKGSPLCQFSQNEQQIVQLASKIITPGMQWND